MLEMALSRMLYPSAASLWGMTLAERVQEALKAAKANGHSVAKIAAACGISKQAVYQWAKGDSKEIDGSNLAELAELSGYRPLWIMKEKGARSDPPAIQRAVALMRQMDVAHQTIAVKVISPLVEDAAETARAPAAAFAPQQRESNGIPLSPEARQIAINIDAMRDPARRDQALKIARLATEPTAAEEKEPAHSRSWPRNRSARSRSARVQNVITPSSRSSSETRRRDSPCSNRTPNPSSKPPPYPSGLASA